MFIYTGKKSFQIWSGLQIIHYSLKVFITMPTNLTKNILNNLHSFFSCLHLGEKLLSKKLFAEYVFVYFWLFKVKVFLTFRQKQRKGGVPVS